MNGSLVILRPVFLWLARSVPWLGKPAITVRWFVLRGIGYPLTAVTAVLHSWAVLAGPMTWRHGLALTLIVLAIEKILGAFDESPVRLWQLTWSFKVRWPAQWAIIDSTSADVQASLGGGLSALSASVRKLPRPVLNHPPLSVWPRINWVDWSATWMVGGPNGQTLMALERTTTAISNQFPTVLRTELDYGTPDDSFGAMRLWFRKPPDHLEGAATADMDATTPLPVDDIEAGEVTW